MDIATLQAFLATADSGSFSTAAERLFLTQPAVSKRIAALEADLKTPLFDRIGRGIQLTRAGQALLPRAIRILTEVEDSRRAIANLQDRIEGPLRVGTSHHIGLHRLPAVLRGFNRRHPAVALDLKFLDSEAACQEVARGLLELAIVTLPATPPDRLQVQRVWHDPLRVVAGRGHALAKIAHPQPAQLAAWPAILPASSTYTRKIVEQAFAPLHLQLQVSLSTNYLETIKMLVSVGLGWSVLPETMLDRQLREVPVRGLAMARDLGLVWHRERTLSNAARALMTMVSAT